MFQTKRIFFFATIIFLFLAILTTNVVSAKTYDELKKEQLKLENQHQKAKCDVPNKRVNKTCAPIEKNLKSLYAQLKSYSDDGGVTKGTNEIPFWGDVPNGEIDKAYDFSDIEGSIDTVTGKEWQGVDGEGVKIIKSKAEGFVHTISALIFGFAVIMVTFAGFTYATSEGDARKTQQAKMQIIAAGIGIGIALFNLVIIDLYASIINVFS